MTQKPSVLFLCTGNSTRSIMAEAWLRYLAGDRFDVFSAGIEPKTINPLTIKVMSEAGVSLEGQYSKPLSLYYGKKEFDYVITVCDSANEKCPFFPGKTTRVHWSLEDPAAEKGPEEQRLIKFRKVRDQIKEKIQQFIN